ncbi:MAG: cysteine hydrolase [Chloroflexi bacterium]|nr:cysteine hydrolase [Chloroflexota bacterium]
MAASNIPLNPRETALVMVDMQNDFCHPEGACGRNRDTYLARGLDPELVMQAIPAQKRLLAGAREAGLFVVHTQIVWEPVFDDPQRIHKIRSGTRGAAPPTRREPFIVPGSWGADTHEELKPTEGEYVLTKRGFSAFYGTDLEIVLRRRGIKTLIVAGCITYACVLHTCFDASVRDFDLVMLSDGVASWEPNLQQPTLRIAELLLGAVCSIDEIIEVLQGAKARA